MRWRLPRYMTMAGQLPLPFGEKPKKGHKVSLQEFDPNKHALKDLDRRTIPYKQNREQSLKCIAAACKA